MSVLSVSPACKYVSGLLKHSKVPLSSSVRQYEATRLSGIVHNFVWLLKVIYPRCFPFFQLGITKVSSPGVAINATLIKEQSNNDIPIFLDTIFNIRFSFSFNHQTKLQYLFIQTPIFLIMPNCFLFIFVSDSPLSLRKLYPFFFCSSFFSESHILHITKFI